MKLFQSLKKHVLGTRIQRTSDYLYGVDTQIGDFVFETAKHMYDIDKRKPDQDYVCNVSFSCHKEDFLDSEKRPSISIESDKVSQQQSFMQDFSREKVINHPYIFEVVHYWTKTRLYPLLYGESVTGTSYVIYRFKHNGTIKNLTLRLPCDCDTDEGIYACNALNMVAVSLRINAGKTLI